MTDIVVSGAEYSAANGTYVYGDLDPFGYPYYIHENNGSYITAWGGDGDERWYIYDTSEFVFLYYCAENVATPDLCSSWTDGLTETPSSLTVTASGGTPAQNLTLTCAAGSYSLAGVACTLTYTPAAQNLTLSCGAGSLALTGSSVTFEVKRNYVLSASAGSYALAGVDATLTKNLVLAVTQTTPDVVASGAGTSVVNGLYKYLNNGQYSKNDASALVYPFVYGEWYVMGINGGFYYSAIKAVDTPDLVDNWQVEIDGTAPVPAFTVSPDVGGAFYFMRGRVSTLTVQRNYTLTAEAGTYSLTGSDCTLVRTGNPILACAAGSYAVTGSVVTFAITRAYSLTASAGSYTLTGSAITFGNTKTYILACGTGSYALTGTGVTFQTLRNYTLACSAGSYSLTGTDCTLSTIHNYSLLCTAGSYTLTGTSASLTSSRTMACNAGSYTLTGTNAGLYRALVMACEAGSYALTGTDASLTSHRIFALGMGSYALVGTNAGLFILSPTPACRTYVIKGDGTSSVIAANETYLLTKSFWGQLYWPANYWAKAASLVGTPTGRIYTIDSENRTRVVVAELREWNVNTENREYAVLMENRTYSVPYCTDDD